MALKVIWFDRGRDARSEGRPCVITDARLSSQDRQEWFAGWNHQDRLNGPQMTDEARDELRTFLRDLRETIQSQPD